VPVCACNWRVGVCKLLKLARNPGFGGSGKCWISLVKCWVWLVGRVIDEPHPLPLALSAQNTNSFLRQFQLALVRVSMLTWSADF
jgi:hypothetical protein